MPWFWDARRSSRRLLHRIKRARVRSLWPAETVRVGVPSKRVLLLLVSSTVIAGRVASGPHGQTANRCSGRAGAGTGVRGKREKRAPLPSSAWRAKRGRRGIRCAPTCWWRPRPPSSGPRRSCGDRPHRAPPVGRKYPRVKGERRRRPSRPARATSGRRCRNGGERRRQQPRAAPRARLRGVAVTTFPPVERMWTGVRCVRWPPPRRAGCVETAPWPRGNRPTRRQPPSGATRPQRPRGAAADEPRRTAEDGGKGGGGSLPAPPPRTVGRPRGGPQLCRRRRRRR